MSSRSLVPYSPRVIAKYRKRSALGSVVRTGLRMTPYVGDAMRMYGQAKQVYKRGREIYEEFKPRKKQDTRPVSKEYESLTKSKTMPKSYGGYGSGKYKGSFAALKVTKPSGQDKALTQGFGASQEVFGSCSGNQIVWVGASTCEISEISKVVSSAIIRKLLKKAGITITNPNVSLQTSFEPGVTSIGFTIIRVRIGADGTESRSSYETVAGETLSTLAANCGLASEVIDYASGTSDLITENVLLYQKDQGTVAAVRLVANLDLKNEIVKMNMKVKLVVQNRTKPASTTDTSTDVIDAQPLKGKIYYFKKENPQVRIQGSVSLAPNTETLLGRWSNNAVKLVSDTSAGYDAQLQKPPTPYYFQNCSKCSSVSLEPGDIKQVNLNNSLSQYYQNFIRKLAWFNGAGIRRQNIGDCVFVCLEERLNSGSANPIRCQYELESTHTAFLTTGKTAPMRKTFTEVTVSHA